MGIPVVLWLYSGVSKFAPIADSLGHASSVKVLKYFDAEIATYAATVSEVCNTKSLRVAAMCGLDHEFS
tara:strand:+ start:278 stop:484 length:207 start_codon:yes stop_codon:yes gene_type:complete